MHLRPNSDSLTSFPLRLSTRSYGTWDTCVRNIEISKYRDLFELHSIINVRWITIIALTKRNLELIKI